MDIDVYKLRCSTSIADCSLLTLELGNIHLPVRLILCLNKTLKWLLTMNDIFIYNN